MQLKFVFTTVEGTELELDAVAIIYFVEEDGETKILTIKDFSDPEQRSAINAEAVKVVGRGALAA